MLRLSFAGSRLQTSILPQNTISSLVGIREILKLEIIHNTMTHSPMHGQLRYDKAEFTMCKA